MGMFCDKQWRLYFLNNINKTLVFDEKTLVFDARFTVFETLKAHARDEIGLAN